MARGTVVIFLAIVSFLCLAACATAQKISDFPHPTQAPINTAASSARDRAKYAGDAACVVCHRDRSVTYQHTSHHLTSQLANQDTILGSFTGGSNMLIIADAAISDSQPALFFKMEKKKDGHYETAVASWGSDVRTRTERIDVVFGSGVRGQTFLYWKGDALFEMPVSYWADGHRWINSPGYRDGSANFVRPIYPRCLECHATYIHPLSSDPLTNLYDKSSLVTGISCETCHGPGANHIAREKSALPKPSASSAILNPATFSRDRQVDMCALCHNGAQRQVTAPAFSYVPGEPLDNYFKPNPMEVVEHPDVHGNQVGLLKRSRCYLSSPNMTCSTCHDVHAPEKPAAEYSVRCLTCHRVENCGMSKTMGHAIAKNCIDCHMPVEPADGLVSMTAGNVVRARLRTHWIKVYPAIQQP